MPSNTLSRRKAAHPDHGSSGPADPPPTPTLTESPRTHSMKLAKPKPLQQGPSQPPRLIIKETEVSI